MKLKNDIREGYGVRCAYQKTRRNVRNGSGGVVDIRDNTGGPPSQAEEEEDRMGKIISYGYLRDWSVSAESIYSNLRGFQLYNAQWETQILPLFGKLRYSISKRIS